MDIELTIHEAGHFVAARALGYEEIRFMLAGDLGGGVAGGDQVQDPSLTRCESRMWDRARRAGWRLAHVERQNEDAHDSVALSEGQMLCTHAAYTPACIDEDGLEIGRLAAFYCAAELRLDAPACFRGQLVGVVAAAHLWVPGRFSGSEQGQGRRRDEFSTAIPTRSSSVSTQDRKCSMLPVTGSLAIGSACSLAGWRICCLRGHSISSSQLWRSIILTPGARPIFFAGSSPRSARVVGSSSPTLSNR
jgi:hypothetical protein